jgi:isopentenyl phosphate kinase
LAVTLGRQLGKPTGPKPQFLLNGMPPLIYISVSYLSILDFEIISGDEIIVRIMIPLKIYFLWFIPDPKGSFFECIINQRSNYYLNR